MQKINYKTVAAASVATSISLIAGYFLVSGQKMGMLPYVLLCVILFLLGDRKNVLYLFLLLLPFFSNPDMAENLVEVPGAKPFNILGAFTLLLFFVHGGRLHRNHDAIERNSMLFLMLYYGLFSLALFRSCGYIEVLSAMAPENFHNNTFRYLLSFYVRPSLYIVPFIYILKHVREESDIYQCVGVICLSILLLSSVLVIACSSHIVSIASGRNATNEIIGVFFGMHYNAVGSMYICVVPLLVLQYVRNRKLASVTYALSFVAVCLLQSRSTIAIFLCGTILSLYLFNRKRLMVGVIGLAVIFFLCLLPDFLARALTTGMEEGDANSLLTGRVDSIWVPLLSERLSHFSQFLFGVGRYSMVVSPLYSQGAILHVYTAHNAFVEFFIDNGFALFSLLIILMAWFLKKGREWARKIDTPLAWALFLCIITYLIGTISGRTIYPDHHNMYLFPITALYINYIRIKVKQTGDE